MSEREHSVEIWHIYSLSPKNISSSQTISVVIYIFSKTVTFTKLLPDMRENSSNFHTAHCGKTRNSLSPKNISSNQLFSNLSSNSLLSRIFFQKCVRENSRNFHTHCALCTLHCTVNVDITEIPSHTILEKIRESNGFTKEIAKWLVWRKCFDESKFLFFSTRIHWKNISSKQLFSKYVTLTNFLPKKCERHSLEICKFFPRDFFAKISSN